jgi:hypothetical protein
LYHALPFTTSTKLQSIKKEKQAGDFKSKIVTGKLNNISLIFPTKEYSQNVYRVFLL